MVANYKTFLFALRLCWQVHAYDVQLVPNGSARLALRSNDYVLRPQIIVNVHWSLANQGRPIFIGGHSNSSDTHGYIQLEYTLDYALFRECKSYFAAGFTSSYHSYVGADVVLIRCRNGQSDGGSYIQVRCRIRELRETAFGSCLSPIPDLTHDLSRVTRLDKVTLLFV